MSEDGTIKLGIVVGLFSGIWLACYILRDYESFLHQWWGFPYTITVLAASLVGCVMLFGTLFCIAHRIISKK